MPCSSFFLRISAFLPFGLGLQATLLFSLIRSFSASAVHAFGKQLAFESISKADSRSTSFSYTHK